MQNILNKISIHLTTSTKNLHNFNAKLNKFLAHAPSNQLHPYQPTISINIFIQKYDDSGYMHQSYLCKKNKHDTLTFLSPTFEGTNTFNSTTANCSSYTSNQISNNHANQYKQNNKREKNKLPTVCYISLYKFPLLSLFSIQRQKHRRLTYKRNTFRNKTKMPPSPINLPFSMQGTSPVLSPLPRKKSPFKPIAAPKPTPDATLTSPIQLGVRPATAGATDPQKPITIRDTIPIEAPKQNYAESISGLPPSIDYSSDTLFVMC